MLGYQQTLAGLRCVMGILLDLQCISSACMVSVPTCNMLRVDVYWCVLMRCAQLPTNARGLAVRNGHSAGLALRKFNLHCIGANSQHATCGDVYWCVLMCCAQLPTNSIINTLGYQQAQLPARSGTNKFSDQAQITLLMYSPSKNPKVLKQRLGKMQTTSIL